MNNGLQRTPGIRPDELDGEHYFQSLVERAHAKELLSDREVERLQVDCLDLLAAKVERYNRGYSSSIRAEEAGGIMASCLFTLGLALKVLPTPDDAVDALIKEPLADLYQRGRKRIDTLVRSSKTIHAKLLGELVDSPNIYYRSTADEGIKGFFKLYDPDYGAQLIHITADYPLCRPLPPLAGIEFIHAYLTDLYHENAFCRQFAPDDIHHLLCGWEAGYEELLVNLYEPVLSTAIGCALVETDVRRLDLSAGDIARLGGLFGPMSAEEIAATLEQAARAVEEQLALSPGVGRYVQDSLPRIADKIALGGQVFCVPAYPGDRPRLHVPFGERMPDDAYRKWVAEVDACRHLTDKLAIIREQVRSLSDLEYLLLDALWTEEEMGEVICGMGPVDIAALVKKYRRRDMDPSDRRESEQMLGRCLEGYLAGLQPGQRAWILGAVEAIEDE